RSSKLGVPTSGIRHPTSVFGDRSSKLGARSTGFEKKNPPAIAEGLISIIRSKRLIIGGYLEGDRLLTESVHLATVLDGRGPGRGFLQYTDRFLFHSVAVVGKGADITNRTIFTYHELDVNSIHTFGSTVVNRNVRVQVSFEELTPGRFTTFKRSFDF